MAVAYISEYGGFAPGPLPVGFEPSLRDFTLAIGAAVVSTQGFDTATTIIRVHTDAICSILIAPTTASLATTSNKRMAANATEYFAVKAGHKISVISNT